MGADTMQRQATLDPRLSQPLGGRYGPKTAWALDGAGPATSLHQQNQIEKQTSVKSQPPNQEEGPLSVDFLRDDNSSNKYDSNDQVLPRSSNSHVFHGPVNRHNEFYGVTDKDPFE